jgi:phospholipid transport system substrate-binding protein
MKQRVVSLLIALLFAAAIAGAEAVPAETVVKTMVDEVLAVLAQKEQPAQARLDAIIKIITPDFDFSLMAKLTLGPTYWPQLDVIQQQDFTDLFVKKLRRVYSEQVENFSGETVVFEEPRPVGNKVHLMSYVISKGQRVSILYKLYESGDAWKIYDLEIQDVSIVSSYRAQFVPIVRDRSPAALIQDLRDNLGEENTK